MWISFGNCSRVFPKLHKSDISGIFVQNWHQGVSKSVKNKVASTENHLKHQPSMDYKADALTTQPISHSLQVSDFQTLKSHTLLNLQMI